MARVGNLLVSGEYKHYKHSGFTDTITDSYTSPYSPVEGGIAWKPSATAGTISCGDNVDKFYIHTGFSTTISSSFSSPDTAPGDLCWDGSNILSTNKVSPFKHYQHVGITSSINDSYTAPTSGGGMDEATGIAWIDQSGYGYTGVISIGGSYYYYHDGFSDTIIDSYSLGPGVWDRAVACDGGNTLYQESTVCRRRTRLSAVNFQTCNLADPLDSYGIGWDSKDVQWGDASLAGEITLSGTLSPYYISEPAPMFGDVISADLYTQKHYRHRGFSANIVASYSTANNLDTGIAWTGTDVISANMGQNKHYKHSGFSNTITDSYNSPDVDPVGISWDTNNVVSTDTQSDKIYRHVGFSATIFLSYTGPGSNMRGMSWDDLNTYLLSCSNSPAKHYRHDGFSDTIVESYNTIGANPLGMTWDTQHVISADATTDKHYRHSGFTATIRQCYSAEATFPTGLGYMPTELNYKTSTGGITFSGSLTTVKQATPVGLTGTLTLTGALTSDKQESFARSLSGTLTPSGALSTRLGIHYTKSLAGGLSFLVGTESSGIAGTRRDGSDPPPAPQPPHPPESNPTFHLSTLRGRQRFWGIVGTRRSGASPPAPHPPETGITFHLHLSGSFMPEGNLDGTEYIWPTGTFDKGAIFDTMTMDEEVVSGGPDGKVAASRNHPHRGKYYLAVHNPPRIFDAEVATVTADVGGTQVTYVSATGTYTDCLAGMTVKVYTSAGVYKGKVRLRSITSNTLNVAEQDHLDWTIGDLFEIYDVMELWAKFPRVIEDPGNPGTLIFYRDWDVTPVSEAYPMKSSAARCVPIIGPPTCAFLESGSASIYFTAKHSYNVNSGLPPAWWSWAFQSGTPTTSAVVTPGDVAWTAAGTYRVKCAVEDAAPGHTPVATYRYVHIFERTGANAPYTNFRVTNFSGSVSEGGWNAEFEVYDDVDVADFPDGAQIILFAEELLGDYVFGAEFALEDRQNVKYIGYVVSGSVIKDPDTRVVRFRTVGIQMMMQNRDNFSIALDYSADGDATVWEKQSGLSANYAFLNLLMWNSTLMNITDVFLPAYYYENWLSVTHKASEYLAKYQDFERDTLWSQLSTLAADVFARVLVSKFGEVSIVNDPQYTDETNLWADLPVPYTFAAQDWEAPITIEFVDEPVVSVVCVEGIAFDGATASAVIGYHPGELPTYRGKMETKSRCILTSVDEAEILAEHLYSIRNNTYPMILINCLGNYSFLDLVDYGGIQMSLVAADTRYGLAWTDRRLFIESIAHTLDFTTGVLTTQLQLVAFAYLRRPRAGA